MNLPLPSAFKAALSSDRLETVSRWLLEEFYATEDDLSRSTDSGYSRGCTAFDRQRNRILAEERSKKHSWLGLVDSGFALVFSIGDVPCRFSNDDPLNPTKSAVVATNRYQMAFLEFAADDHPGRFCFVIDRGTDGTDEPRVEFLGFKASGDVACRWSTNTVRVFHSVDAPAAPSVEIGKPPVTPKRRDEERVGDPQNNHSNKPHNDAKNIEQ
ncbi:MAG: hypothetical protein ABI114_10840 [Rhodanobacter sp.]